MGFCGVYGKVFIPVRGRHVFQRSIAQRCHFHKADCGVSGACGFDFDDEDWMVEEGWAAAG